MRMMSVVIVSVGFALLLGPRTASAEAQPEKKADTEMAARAKTAAKKKAAAFGKGGILKDIPPGYRGVTIPVKHHQLVNIKRGDRVDVLVTFDAAIGEPSDQRRETVTATLLQNVIVFSIGKGIVELVLNAHEAQYAVLAIDEQKSIWIVRRGKGDTEMQPLDMAAFRKLFQ